MVPRRARGTQKRSLVAQAALRLPIHHGGYGVTRERDTPKGSRWTKQRHPHREGDRFLMRLAQPLKKRQKKRQLSKPYLMQIKDGKLYFVLTKPVEVLSIASPFRPDLGDVWKAAK